MRHLRRLILCFLIAWLPIQGIAVAAMPFCKHERCGADAGPHQIVPAAHELHQHGRQGAEPDQHTGVAGIACNDCSACHLACGSSMLCADIVIFEIHAQHALHPRAAALPHFFFPDQPSRPPLSAIA
jgi:hypothetical protein